MERDIATLIERVEHIAKKQEEQGVDIKSLLDSRSMAKGALWVIGVPAGVSALLTYLLNWPHGR